MSSNREVRVRFPFAVTTVTASDGSTIDADAYGTAVINANLMAGLLSAGFTEIVPQDGQCDYRFSSQTSLEF